LWGAGPQGFSLVKSSIEDCNKVEWFENRPTERSDRQPLVRCSTTNGYEKLEKEWIRCPGNRTLVVSPGVSEHQAR
jgi:hypothetical protein